MGLTYEIAAGRVLAPFFGTSLLTWTAVIATVLAGFSLGSAMGGFIAERPRAEAVAAVRKALVGTAILMALSPTILAAIYGLGARETGGMLLSVVIAFFPASVLVTLPSPLLAKIAVEARPGREGSSLGIVLAAGSIGAIFGAVLAGFALLPLIGSAATFAACGAVALACVPVLRDASPEARQVRADMPAALGPAAVVVALSVLTGPVCQYESGLSCIDVVERGATVNLYSDRTLQAAERTSPGEAPAADLPPMAMPYTRWIEDRMRADLLQGARVLFIGGGGYTLPARLIARDEQARAVAVEIDPLVTRVVTDHLPHAADIIARTGYSAGIPLATTGDQDRLGIVHADGRVFINETTERFDAAVMDAFSSGSVPAHLATRETYARLRAITRGPVYVNLIDAPGGRLARGMHAILSDLYPFVRAIEGPVSGRGRANILLAAAPFPLSPLDDLPSDYAEVTIAEGRAFTDDRGWVGHR